MSRSKKKGKMKYSEKDFEEFLKESISDEDTSIDTARISEYLDPKKKKAPATSYYVSDDDDDDFGGIGMGSRFMKSSKVETPKPAARKMSKEHDLKNTRNEADLSRDSLDDVSLRDRNDIRKPGPAVPALSLGSSYTDTPTESQNMNNGVGMDTLQEMREKEKFFEDLQKRSGDGTLDYSKLNRDLDGSATLAATAMPTRKQDTFDESGDYGDLRANNVESGDDEEFDQEAEDKKQSMLAKVSLLDSLDSTLGTKQGSHDLKGDSSEMKPIEEEYDDLDGHTERTTINRKASASKTMDYLKVEQNSQKESTDHTGTNKGITLKTQSGTGLHYTDTSHEIEALHNAMRQFGTGTMDTKDFTLQGSSASALVATGQTANSDEGTGGFGMKPVAPPRSDKSRTVDDIIREVEELRTNTDEEPRGFVLHQTPAAQKYSSDKDLETGSFNVNSVDTNKKGFDLSPAATAYNHTADQGEDVSAIDKYPPQSSGSIDFHSSTTTAHRLYPPDEDLPHSVPDSPNRGKKVKKRFSHIKSSGYGRKNLPPQSPPRKSTSKQPSTNWSPADTFRQKVKGTESLNKKTLKVSKSSVDEKLMQSVESFANYIQQFTTNSKDHPEVKFSEESPKLSSRSQGHGLQSALIAEAQDWRNQWKEERKKLAKLQGELANQEREHHEKIEALRVQHEEEVFNIKQENFILSAKVAELEKQVDARKRIAEGGSLESASSDQAERLEKEIRDQEKLLAGYQSENERLYQDMKKIQGETKATHERMFRENERLKTEVRSLKENLERKEVQLRNKGLITGTAAQQEIAANSAVLGAGRIAQLEAELRQTKAKDLSLQREVDVLRKAKEELEKHVDELVRKIGEFEGKVVKAKSLQSQEVKDVEKKYEFELEKLNRKLKWYAENQDLLDKDSDQLRKKDAEIKELQEKVDFLQTEHGRRQAEAKARMKERNTDSKKIQDLQRQVREMENILRKRNPNSLPVLMWAASSAPEPEGKKAPSVEHLENRVKKLEAELDEKDEESKKSLRVVEQKYNTMKLQFEERQRDLEARLSKYERPGDKNIREGEHPHTHISALEKELESVKDRYKRRLADAENEADRLRKEIVALKSKETVANRNEAKSSKEAEIELQVRLKTLQNDLADSNREKQFLQTTIDRLQKEKQQLIIDATKRADKSAKGLPPSRGIKSKIDTKSKSKPAGNKKLTFRTESDSDSEQLPPMSMTQPNGVHNSVYQPQNFAQSHIDDILRENEDLKLKLERAEWEKDSHRVHLQKLQAEAEARDRRLREDAEEQITALRMTHQHEMQHILSEHAMQHSMSRVAELQAKVDSQEVMIRHLRHQIADAEVDQEKLSTLKIREATLETQVKELLDDLQEAKKSHAPEMRHFDALQEKIKKLESRHVEREHELQSLLRQSHAAATAELQSEIAKWKRTVELKNREIEHFRLELDNILEVLKELRRQGVVLPGFGSQLSLASARSAGSAYTSTPR